MRKNFLRPSARLRLKIPKRALVLGLEIQKDIKNLSLKNWTNLENGPPNTLNFNLTEFCNARCKFCSYRFSKPNLMMSNEIFKNALVQYYDMGGRRVCLNSVLGEPLLTPDVQDKFNIIKDVGKFSMVYLFSNGILLNKPGIVEQLLDSPLNEIHISTGGFDRDYYNNIMGVERYDQFLTGFRKLLIQNKEFGYKKDIFLEIRGPSTVLFTKDFEENVIPFVDEDFIRTRISFLRLYDDWMGAISLSDIPPGSKFLPYGKIRIRPCSRTFSLAILASGDIRICDCRIGQEKNDDLIIGNISNDNLKDIWYGDKIKEIRRKTVNKHAVSVCRNCRMYEPV
jgi:radical SAM protein with 4Fe4S-binding SPASM domain